MTLAANRDALDIVKFLHTTNPELLNSINPAGFTPCLAAAMGGAIHVITYLLEQNRPDILESQRTVDGKNALALAAINNHVSVLEQLCQAGFQINTQNPKTGKTALMEAVLNEKIEAVKSLITFEADIAIKDMYGFTVFHLAAYSNNEEILNYLFHTREPKEIALLLQEKAMDGRVAKDLASSSEIFNLIEQKMILPDKVAMFPTL